MSVRTDRSGAWTLCGFPPLVMVMALGAPVCPAAAQGGGDQAPVVSVPATAFVRENDSLTVDVTAADPDGEAIVSLVAIGLPTGATFRAGPGNTAGALSWRPSFDQAGTYKVFFTASNALSGSDSTTITIENVDRAPVVSAPVTACAAEGLRLRLAVRASDADTADSIALLTASGVPPGATFTAGLRNSTGTLDWTPGFNTSGTHTVTFTAANALSGSASTTITITVGYPNIPAWAFTGAYRPAAQGDTIEARPRALTLRWLRDPAAEASPDFGGYRIYRATSIGDTSTMVLVRRFSKQFGDSIFTWHFRPIDCGTPLQDRVATFIDPDSSGRFIKVCRFRNPQNDPNGACLSPRDSVMILAPPPGPHDGFRTWYGITYEARNTTDNDYLDQSIPDTLKTLAPCGATGTDRDSCANLNHKAANVSNDVGQPRAASADPDSHFFARAVEPTEGPTANLSQVGVVPNPYRAAEAWNPSAGHELHFVNLPAQARIRIYTLAGDLVRDIRHGDPVRDFERWDLKNGAGRDVASGIYMYRVEAERFTYQSRFVVIR